MNDCNCCKKKLTTESIVDQPIDELESLPDYILAERIVINEATGNTRHVMTRVPSAKLFGSGTMDNVTTIEPNNDEIEVGENTVLAARLVNNGSYNSVELTTDSTEPDFLIIGKLGTDLLIQSTGFVYFPNGHQYIAGQTYYSSEDGEPTTSSTSGHKLFKAISSTKLVIKLGQ